MCSIWRMGVGPLSVLTYYKAQCLAARAALLGRISCPRLHIPPGSTLNCSHPIPNYGH